MGKNTGKTAISICFFLPLSLLGTRREQKVNVLHPNLMTERRKPPDTFVLNQLPWQHLALLWWNHSLAAALNTWKAQVVVLFSRCSLSFLCIPGIKVEWEETHKNAVVAYVHLVVMEVCLCSRTNTLGNFSIWSCWWLHDYQERFCLSEEITCGDDERITMHLYSRFNYLLLLDSHMCWISHVSDQGEACFDAPTRWLCHFKHQQLVAQSGNKHSEALNW